MFISLLELTSLYFCQKFLRIYLYELHSLNNIDNYFLIDFLTILSFLKINNIKVHA